MTINEIKQKAIDGASKIAMSPPVMKMLSNPNVQKAFLAMINANAEVREWFEGQLHTFARGMSLATSEDLGSLRKKSRDAKAELEILRDQVAALEARVATLEVAKPKKTAASKASSGTKAKAKAKAKTRVKTKK